MKRTLMILFCFAILCLPCAALNVSAESAILIEAQGGQVLWSKNCDEKMPIASTTKIMTGIIAVETCNLNDMVEITPEMVGAQGSSIYLKAGEKLTINDLLYGLLLNSGNDAAEAIALHSCGSIEAFVGLMNSKAIALGLTNTSFCNPNGLDAQNHYSTARDLANLGAYCMNNKKFKEIVSTKRFTIPENEVNPARYLLNHNRLLGSFEGVDGIKTGFTKKSGRCLVTSAVRNGMRLICVTLNAPDDWNDHKRLLDYGFNNYEQRQIVAVHELNAKIFVAGYGYIDANNEDSVSITCNKSSATDMKISIRSQKIQYPPILAGQNVATAEIYIGGNKVTECPLYSCDSVTIPEKKSILDRFLSFIKSLVVYFT